MKKSDILQRVLEIDISKIIGKYIDLKRSGVDYTGLCPFHNDNKIGSFKVSKGKNMFNCFSCGAAGNVINFVSKIKGISFDEALIKIAEEENIISYGHGGMHYINHKKDMKDNKGSKITKSNNMENNTDVALSHHLAYREKLDYIYRLFLDQLIISKEHIEYLSSYRGLSRHTIEKRIYKSYPKSEILQSFIDTLVRLNFDNNELEGEELIDELLTGIPGFYKERIGENWIWKIPKFQGIIIPIKDADGFIVGLQIRKDCDSNSRYIWFSSSFANNYENKRFGTSPGSPIDIIYPDNALSKTIYITEGRFKSEVISEAWGTIAISVQGVGNWKGIDEEIRKLTDKFGNEFFQKIYIAFDSDILYKEQVYNQVKNMSNEIGNFFPDIKIEYLTWNPDKGKGIDDLFSYCRIKNIDYNESIRLVEKDQIENYITSKKKIK